MPCHYSWIKVLVDFILDPALGPKSRIRRSIRSDALKSNATDLKNKSKVNEVLHDVDNNNNNNHNHLSKEERKMLHKKKESGKTKDLSSSSRELTNGHHSKNE
jgi:hypothetical protein